jgi:hypothetical protein
VWGKPCFVTIQCLYRLLRREKKGIKRRGGWRLCDVFKYISCIKSLGFFLVIVEDYPTRDSIGLFFGSLSGAY